MSFPHSVTYFLLCSISVIYTPLSLAHDAQHPLAITSSLSMDEQAARLSQFFDKEVIVSGPKVVDCTLSGGAKTQCLQIEVQSVTDHEQGPWCPNTVNEGIQKGGMMFYDGEVYGIDGGFIKNLAQFFNDDQWQLFNPKTGVVNVTRTKKACAAAAKPDVEDEYRNYCVQCQVSYMGNALTTTYIIPIKPVIDKGLQRANEFTGYGVAFNGVKFDVRAPIEHILGAYTLAPFDACGGHVNLHVGYHYHAAMGCSTQWRSVATHAPIIGLAVDGHLIYSRLNADGQEPDDLDSCRGHRFANLGYHYHVNLPAKNQILGCLKGQQGCALDQKMMKNKQGGMLCDASQRPLRPLRPPKERPPKERPPKE